MRARASASRRRRAPKTRGRAGSRRAKEGFAATDDRRARKFRGIGSRSGSGSGSGSARACCYWGGVNGAQVETPAPMIWKPTSAT